MRDQIDQRPIDMSGKRGPTSAQNAGVENVVPHFRVLHFWSFILDIIGPAFSGPAFSAFP